MDWSILQEYRPLDVQKFASFTMAKGCIFGVTLFERTHYVLIKGEERWHKTTNLPTRRSFVSKWWNYADIPSSYHGNWLPLHFDSRLVSSSGHHYRATPLTATASAFNGAPLNATGRQELMELRKKLKRVEIERDILAKATAWFANSKAAQEWCDSTSICTRHLLFISFPCSTQSCCRACTWISMSRLSGSFSSFLLLPGNIRTNSCQGRLPPRHPSAWSRPGISPWNIFPGGNSMQFTRQLAAQGSLPWCKEMCPSWMLSGRSVKSRLISTAGRYWMCVRLIHAGVQEKHFSIGNGHYIRVRHLGGSDEFWFSSVDLLAQLFIWQVLSDGYKNGKCSQ